MDGILASKEMLLMLYQRRDAKRRRFLYLYYEHLFSQQYSMGFLVELINRDLGKTLVSAYDIKYVRANALKWKSELPSDQVDAHAQLKAGLNQGSIQDTTLNQTTGADGQANID